MPERSRTTTTPEPAPVLNQPPGRTDPDPASNDVMYGRHEHSPDQAGPAHEHRSHRLAKPSDYWASKADEVSEG